MSFFSRASNLVADDNDDISDVFLYNRNTEAIERIDRGPDRFFPVGSSISADGLFVAIPTSVGNGDILVYDRAAASFERVAAEIAVEVIGGNGESNAPSVSEDGRFVAFESSASNLVDGDTNNASDIFVYDRDSDSNQLLTVGANGDSFNASMSGDGRFVAFESSASNLVIGDNNGVTDIFVYDRELASTELLTLGGNENSVNPSISGDGRFVAFESLASTFAEGDTNGLSDIFVYDRETQTTELLIANANGESTAPSISRDGRFVAFVSQATNFFGGDDRLTAVLNIFVYDRTTDSTEQLTTDTGQQFIAGEDGSSTEPVILSLIHI